MLYFMLKLLKYWYVFRNRIWIYPKTYYKSLAKIKKRSIILRKTKWKIFINYSHLKANGVFFRFSNKPTCISNTADGIDNPGELWKKPNLECFPGISDNFSPNIHFHGQYSPFVEDLRPFIGFSTNFSR